MKRTELRKHILDNEDDDDSKSKRRRTPINSIKNEKLTFDKHEKMSNMVRSEIDERTVTMSKVFELDLSMDEYIWFSEYLDILKFTPPYTEERYLLNNIIYKKYQNLKNVDTDKLKKIRIDSGIDDDVVTRILNSPHNDSVKAILYKKYKKYCDSGDGSSEEFFKAMNWIDNVLNVPVNIEIDNNVNVGQTLIKLWKSLNKNTYGLYDVKEKIMEAMCAKLLDPTGKGRVITLVGSPGVGKTTIAASIAESLEMPFDQISLGSIKDSSALTGHSSTYVGSVPGLFTTILLKSKRLDTVILLDEIDKIQPYTQEGTSISSVLLHVLDRTQNNKFRDMYMPEINLDLSKIIFVCAANSLEELDNVLKDRMTIIEINGYDVNDKIQIIKNHLFPKIRNELKFSEKDIIFSDDIIEYMIKNKTENKPGMRDCEKKIYQLCERLALLKYTNGINFSFEMKQLKFPLKITREVIDDLL